MTPGSIAVLPLILIAIGIGCVILSFLVPDRKKSLISLGLAFLVIITGFIHLGSGAINRYRWNQRMRELQRDQRADLDAIREKMKEKPGDANTTGSKPAAPATKN